MEAWILGRTESGTGCPLKSPQDGSSGYNNSRPHKWASSGQEQRRGAPGGRECQVLFPDPLPLLSPTAHRWRWSQFPKLHVKDRQ